MIHLIAKRCAQVMRVYTRHVNNFIQNIYSLDSLVIIATWYGPVQWVKYLEVMRKLCIKFLHSRKILILVNYTIITFF